MNEVSTFIEGFWAALRPTADAAAQGTDVRFGDRLRVFHGLRAVREGKSETPARGPMVTHVLL
ncbi:hypothetical protein ACXR0O_14965 [Verrucomicrobiota bacterium sgz303538]